MINCKARIIFDEKLLQISCQIKKLKVIEIVKTFLPQLFPYWSQVIMEIISSFQLQHFFFIFEQPNDSCV